MSVAEPVSVPLYAHRNDEGHYTWDGVKYPSVTTIIQLFSGDYLAPWAAKLSAQECAEIVANRQGGLLSLDESDEMILAWNDRMTAHIRFRDHAARRGSIIHHCLYDWVMGVRMKTGEWHDYLLFWIDKLGLTDPFKDVLDQGSYTEQLAREARHYFANALAWLEKEKPEFLMIGSEAVVVNEEHGYAGTQDAVVRYQGKRIIDFKNTKQKQERKWLLQLEAYRHAEFIGLVETGEKLPQEETTGSGVLWIKPMDPCEFIPFDPSDDYFEAFLAMRQAFGVLHDMPKPNTKTRQVKQPRRDRYIPGF